MSSSLKGGGRLIVVVENILVDAVPKQLGPFIGGKVGQIFGAGSNGGKGDENRDERKADEA